MNYRCLAGTQMPLIRQSAKKHHNNSLNKNNPSQTNIITQIQNNNYAPRAFSTPKNNKSSVYKSKLLPEKSHANLTKKTLLLDLDETLVHSSFMPFDKSDIILKVEFDEAVYNIHVLVRPDVNEFLTEVSKYFELVIFTASLSNYASPLIDIIDPQKLCSFRLYREHCTYVNGLYVKDLKRIGRDMKSLILLDNSPISYAFTVENGLPIVSWFNDKKDKELVKYIPILKFLSQVDDVRKYIKQFVNDGELNYMKTMKIIENYYNTKQNKQKEEKDEISNLNSRVNSPIIHNKKINNFIESNNTNNNNGSSSEPHTTTKTRWFKGAQNKYQKNEDEIQKQDNYKLKKNKVDLILKNSSPHYTPNQISNFTSKHSQSKNNIFSKDQNTNINLFSGANTVKNETTKTVLQNNFFPLKLRQYQNKPSKEQYMNLQEHQTFLNAFPLLNNNTTNNRIQQHDHKMPLSQRIKMQQSTQFKLKLSNSSSFKMLDLQHSNSNKSKLTINKIVRSRSTGKYAHNGNYVKPQTPKISSHNSFSNLNKFYFDNQNSSNRFDFDKQRMNRKIEKLHQRTATAQFRKTNLMKQN